MSHTSREPSTKFFGPNYPLMPIAAPAFWLMQLHNLKPGDTWNPAWETELLAPMTFYPGYLDWAWYWPGIAFWGTWRYTINDVLLIVRSRLDRSYAFLMKVNFLETRWAMNDLIVPTDNFAYDGSAEISFQKG